VRPSSKTFPVDSPRPPWSPSAGQVGRARRAWRCGSHINVEREDYADGVVLVELAPLTDERFVGRAIADRLGVPDTRGQPLVHVLVRVLQPKQLLLVLDNCEHVLGAAAHIAGELPRGATRCSTTMSAPSSGVLPSSLADSRCRQPSRLRQAASTCLTYWHGSAAKSMIQVEPQPDGGVRYRVLEPLRQFGHVRLAEADEVALTRRLHAEYILSLCEAVSRDADWGGLFLRWRDLNAEADNIRVSLEWAVHSDVTELGLRLAGALWVFWTRPDRQARGRLWLKRMLALPDAERYQDLRPRVVVGLAYLSMLQSEMAEAVSLLEEVERVTRAPENDALGAIAMSVHGTALAYLGQTQTAERDLRASLSVARKAPDPWSKGMALNNLGDLMRARGEGAQARAVYEEAWQLFESLDPYSKFVPQGLVHNLGYVEVARGNLHQLSGCSSRPPTSIAPSAAIAVDWPRVHHRAGVYRRVHARRHARHVCTAAPMLNSSDSEPC
jgi:Flp pilus assembly protein TadD